MHCSVSNGLLRHQLRDMIAIVRALFKEGEQSSSIGTSPEEGYALVLQYFVNLVVSFLIFSTTYVFEPPFSSIR
mgnify:CR=1 FL=1